MVWPGFKSQNYFHCQHIRQKKNKKKRCRQSKKKSAENVTQWIGKSFTKTLTVVHNQDIWRWSGAHRTGSADGNN